MDVQFGLRTKVTKELARTMDKGDLTMNRQLLDEVTEHKDLGIFISSSLKVADHCQHACVKANKMLGLIKRTIRHKDMTVMVQLYKSRVRPNLEYCSSVWTLEPSLQ